MIPDINPILQFGFAAVVAFVMILLMWKIVHYGIDAFKELSDGHANDMMRLHDLHRDERIACYSKQEKQIEKFNETINRVMDRIK